MPLAYLLECRIFIYMCIVTYIFTPRKDHDLDHTDHLKHLDLIDHIDHVDHLHDLYNLHWILYLPLGDVVQDL